MIANRKKEGQRLVVETRLVYILKAQCENWNISSDLASALNKISKIEELKAMCVEILMASEKKVTVDYKIFLISDGSFQNHGLSFGTLGQLQCIPPI